MPRKPEPGHICHWRAVRGEDGGGGAHDSAKLSYDLVVGYHWTKPAAVERTGNAAAAPVLQAEPSAHAAEGDAAARAKREADEKAERIRRECRRARDVD